MRLNKYISSTGVCSRREADDFIKNGRVRVNGDLPSIGYRVKNTDRVTLDGKLLESKDEFVYLALNKPVGITCTTETHVEGNIVDFVNYPERIFPIGRLDKPSEGLILLTNDGDLVNEILREENKNTKEYIVTVNKPVDDDFLKGMSKGVKIYNPVRDEYTITKACPVEKIDNISFRIVLSQGLNRQIRRMTSKLGYEVVKLKRVRIKNIHLGDLPVGYWRYLTDEELRDIGRL